MKEYRVGGYNFGPTFGDDAIVAYYGDQEQSPDCGIQILIPLGGYQ